MQNPPQVENELRLHSIISLLDSRQSVVKQLDSLDQINAEINETIIPNLLDDTNELAVLLKDSSLKGPAYQRLIDESDKLEFLINFPSNIDQYLDSPEDLNKCLESFELIEQLYKRHAHQASIVDSLYHVAENRRSRLIQILCRKLEYISEPSEEELLCIVNNLMISGKFNHMDIRLKYLQARDNWFNNACEDNEATFENVLEVHCKGLPMIFKEYQMIFCNKDTKHDDMDACQRKLVDYALNEIDQDEYTIINSWLMLKASIFISSLEIYMNAIHENDIKTPNMIEDTVQKCSKLCKWLSSFGFDFSCQLRPIFIDAISKEIKSCIDCATKNFEVSFTRTVMKSIESLLLPVDDDILRISDLRAHEQLPKSIDHYPIFKIYCLRIIDSLRWLTTAKELISPINLCLDTYGALNTSMSRVVKAIALAMNLDNNSNNIYLTKVAISMTTEIAPYISNYCERFFPEKLVLNMLGLTKTQFRTLVINEPEKFSNLHLDMRLISEPLKPTMPTLLDTISNC